MPTSPYFQIAPYDIIKIHTITLWQEDNKISGCVNTSPDHKVVEWTAVKIFNEKQPSSDTIGETKCVRSRIIAERSNIV